MTRSDLEMDEAFNGPSRVMPPAVEEVELDEKAKPDDVAAEPLDKLDSRADGAAGREQVIDDQDALPRLDRVTVNLQRRGSVLQRVVDVDRLRRQLADLSYRDEPHFQLQGD